jgi:phosphoglycerate dehydrogenase-like enzyme
MGPQVNGNSTTDQLQTPKIAIHPADTPGWITTAVAEAGGLVVPMDRAQGLLWAGREPSELAALLDAYPDLRWVQLAAAGVERYVHLIDDSRTWTCGKGVYGPVVAEHVLMCILALLHELPVLARAMSWQKAAPRSLYDASITIVGAGGIACSLVTLLAPFRVKVSVVRRRPSPIPGVEAVAAPDLLLETIAGADAVVLAAPLTAATRGMFGERALRAMKRDAVLINVARGQLIVTDDLVRALTGNWIGGAALDVTDPEPLPAEHPLWRLRNCMITPHSASRLEMVEGNYSERVRENVRRFARGDRLVGVIDAQAGY